jgi:hypothetical protein
MLPYFTQEFGNAASRSHPFGWNAEKAVDVAREQVGALIGASGKEIVWTSGATESDNLALKGAAQFFRRGSGLRHASSQLFSRGPDPFGGFLLAGARSVLLSILRNRASSRGPRCSRFNRWSASRRRVRQN